jgi:hypothetical protein
METLVGGGAAREVLTKPAKNKRKIDLVLTHARGQKLEFSGR